MYMYIFASHEMLCDFNFQALHLSCGVEAGVSLRLGLYLFDSHQLCEKWAEGTLLFAGTCN